MSTATRTRASTFTHADVKHVNWKIRSDLVRLRGLYAHVVSRLTRDYVEKLSGDLYLWVYSGYASAITFDFYDASSNTRRFAIRYRIARDGSVSSDQDPGGLRYHDLGTISFRANVTYADSFVALTEAEKAEFRDTLSLNWGPTTDELNDGDGYWRADRRYSSNGFGATRNVFQPY